MKDYSYSNVDNSASVVSKAYRDMFGWMACGLGLSALTAYLIFDSGAIFSMLQSQGIMWGLMIASFVMVFVINGAVRKMSFAVASLCFAVYSVIMGAWMAPILWLYTTESIVEVFLITGGTFAAMAVYGHFTKSDLSSVGKICMMGLIGIIIASIVNIFMGSEFMHYAISYIGVAIFCGLTMYDVNKFKKLLNENVSVDGDYAQRVALIGALELYLDFINLFLYLLRILGSRD